MEDLIKRADAIEAYSDIYWIDDRLNLAFREELDKIDEKIRNIPTVEIADRPQGWIPCSERLPETDNTNEINEFDVLLAVRPKKHPERTPQVYIGKLRPVEGDDGSGNFWGIKTASCEWTIWGWSYFREPEVLAWMPLPKLWKGADDETD